MKFVNKLVGLLLCLSSGNAYSMEESALEASERLRQMNMKTKEAYHEYKNKRSFTIRYLDEAMMLAEHLEKTGNLKTLPIEFVTRQIQRAQVHTPEEKQPLLVYILSDLNLSDKESIDCVQYNCIVTRILALASLKPEEILPHGKSNYIDFLKDPCVSPKSPLGDDVMILRDYFQRVRSEILNDPDENNIYFYNMLCHLNFADLKLFSTSPNNYSFLRALSPKKAVSIIDKNPYFGTLTVPYSTFNDFYLLGAALSPEFAPHNYRETKGPLGFWWHDTIHQYEWNLTKTCLKEYGLYKVTRATFLDIFTSALREPNKKERKRTLDFLFIIMHEYFPIQLIIDKLEQIKKPIILHQVFAELESLEWAFPYERNQGLGSLISSNGYPGAIRDDRKAKSKAALDDEFKKAINQFRKDIFKTLRDKSILP